MRSPPARSWSKRARAAAPRRHPERGAGSAATTSSRGGSRRCARSARRRSRALRGARRSATAPVRAARARSRARCSRRRRSRRRRRARPPAAVPSRSAGARAPPRATTTAATAGAASNVASASHPTANQGKERRARRIYSRYEDVAWLVLRPRVGSRLPAARDRDRGAHSRGVASRRLFGRRKPVASVATALRRDLSSRLSRRDEALKHGAALSTTRPTRRRRTRTSRGRRRTSPSARSS